MKSLYVHVPFCTKVCPYCDFAVLSAPDRLHAEYVALVQEEYRLRTQDNTFIDHSSPSSARNFETLYIGGGTPTHLTHESLRDLLATFPKVGSKEKTIEANPEQVDASLFHLLTEYGITRISLGVQSLDDSILKSIGRNHNAHQARQALALLASSGLRCSADMMFQLPGQSLESFLVGLRELCDLGFQHISFYGLTLEDGTLLHQLVRKGRVLLDDGVYAEQYQKGVELLESYGLQRYEVSNFAVAGQESIHNRAYWQRQSYLGVGPGAHSFAGTSRCANPRSYAAWSRWVREGCLRDGQEWDELGPQQVASELLWLGLRQREGFHPESLSLATGMRFGKRAQKIWDQLQQQKQAAIASDGSWVLQNEGWVFLDRIAVALLGDLE